MMSGSTEELNGTIPESAQPSYEALTGAISTTVELTSFTPWIAGLIVLVAILMGLAIAVISYFR